MTIFLIEKKKAFQIKLSISKSRKNCFFPKGLVHGVGQKFENFPIFIILSTIGSENVFDDIRNRKKTYLDNKNTDFKNSKNCIFLKGVSPWFW